MVRAAVIVGAFMFLMAIYSCRGERRRETVSLASFPRRIEKAPQVRIVLKQRASSAEMAVDGPFRIIDSRGREVFNDNSRLGTVRVRFDGSKLLLGAVEMVVKDSAGSEPMSTMRISPREAGSLEIDGKIYPGDVEFIGVPGTRTLHCVLHLNLELYVCGVLGGEVPVDKWHDEALRAQAVASRTYAMFYHLVNAEKQWDFGVSGREAQEFRPGITRNTRIKSAVDSTQGQVLTWNSQLFPAFFHSSCGGHTLDSAKIFTAVSIRPLAGRECSWCLAPELGNKYSSWQQRLTMATINGRLGSVDDRIPEFRKLRGKGEVYALEAAERTPDGRIVRFRARFPYAPGSLELWANDVRTALGTGPGGLLSTKCEMASSRSAVVFKGSGWGHGVGLCQFGSLGMAMAGYGYQDILAYYFPHSQIVRMSYDDVEAEPAGASRAKTQLPASHVPARREMPRVSEDKAKG